MTLNIKMKKEKFKARERKLVGGFEKYFNSVYPAIYTQIDNDSPGRVFKSGYDFQAAYNGRGIYIEFKHAQKAPKDFAAALKLLTPYQNKTRLEIRAAGCIYWVCVFIDGGEVIAVFKEGEKLLLNYEMFSKFIYKRLTGR